MFRSGKNACAILFLFTAMVYGQRAQVKITKPGAINDTFIYGDKAGANLVDGYCDILIGNHVGSEITTGKYLLIIKLDEPFEAFGVVAELSKSLMFYRHGMDEKCLSNYHKAMDTLTENMRQSLSTKKQ